MQHTASHCSTLQHTAALCNTLQHTASCCNTLQHIATHCNTLQHAVTHCNTLQHPATPCNTLQHTATLCSTLRHIYIYTYIYISDLAGLPLTTAGLTSVADIERQIKMDDNAVSDGALVRISRTHSSQISNKPVPHTHISAVPAPNLQISAKRAEDTQISAMATPRHQISTVPAPHTQISAAGVPHETGSKKYMRILPMTDLDMALLYTKEQQDKLVNILTDSVIEAACRGRNVDMILQLVTLQHTYCNTQTHNVINT